ncbi:hypothetical protein QFZ77_003464 [Paenibacillus sp. V4I3]|nr:hypothetical protein [Paenibacillus sp. V4I3]
MVQKDEFFYSNEILFSFLFVKWLGLCNQNI